MLGFERLTFKRTPEFLTLSECLKFLDFKFKCLLKKMVQKVWRRLLICLKMSKLLKIVKIMGTFWEKCKSKRHQVVVSEWLRRQTRNLLGLPAQVRILPTTFFIIFFPLKFSFLSFQIDCFIPNLVSWFFLITISFLKAKICYHLSSENSLLPWKFYWSF